MSLSESIPARRWPVAGTLVVAAVVVVAVVAIGLRGGETDADGLVVGPDPLVADNSADTSDPDAEMADAPAGGAEPETVAVELDSGAGLLGADTSTSEAASNPGATSTSSPATSGPVSTSPVSTTEPSTATTAGPATAPPPSPSTTMTTTPPTTIVGPSGGRYRTCRAPSGGSNTSIDFAAERSAGRAVTNLNQGSLGDRSTFVRAVFELGSDRMAWGSEGVELRIDMADPDATNNRYRAELRETTIDQPIPVGTTQAYCMRFRVNELPDLYGPVKIFQRFNRDLDGPDIGVELTGANQFSDAVPNDLQVVAWDGRHRIGRRLEAVNTLMVVVHNHPTEGSYKVILNGSVLRARSGINTIGASAGGWSQFGLYPHGLYADDGPNRQNQIDSGRTVVRFEYRDFTIIDYRSGPSDLGPFTVG